MSCDFKVAKSGAQCSSGGSSGRVVDEGFGSSEFISHFLNTASS